MLRHWVAVHIILQKTYYFIYKGEILKMKKMKKGFTIVELVIVIGVIAILSAVLIPTFTNLSAKAKKTTALQEATDCYTQYLIDTNPESAKGQTEVVIEKNGYMFKYSTSDGWVDAEASDKKTGPVVLYTSDGDTTVEDGEAVVYERKAA